MNINRLKQLSLINDKFTLEILKSKIFINFQQSFHFSTNISIIEQRISNKNFLKYFQTFPSTFNFEIRKKESKSIRTILKPSKFTYSELLKKKKKIEIQENSLIKTLTRKKRIIRWKKII